MSELTEAAKAVVKAGQEHRNDEKVSLANEATAIFGRVVSDFVDDKSDGAMLRSLIIMITSGNQPRQISDGSGSQSAAQLDDRTAVEHLWNSEKLPENVRKAFRRMFAPDDDPGRLTFGSNGDDTRIDELKHQVRVLTADRDAKKADLEKSNEEITDLEKQLKAKEDEIAELKRNQRPSQAPGNKPESKRGVAQRVRDSVRGGQ